jgi:hypothetical protein
MNKFSGIDLRSNNSVVVVSDDADRILTVIALWLGRESPVTTHGYVEADLAMKERALAAITPPETPRTRYRPTDRC